MQNQLIGEEYTPHLTEQQRIELESHPHTFDFPLSNEQLDFLKEHGYFVVKNVVEPELCERIVSEAFQKSRKYFGFVRHDQSTWHKCHAHGLVNLFNLQSLYELRQYPKLYSIFAQITKTHKLVASVDRVCLKHPCIDPEELNGTNPNDDLQLHTDLNYWYSNPNFPQFQCGICLEDCDLDCGGFYCIPGFNKIEKIEEYKNNYVSRVFGNEGTIPPKRNVFVRFEDKELARREKVTMEMKRGDIVIWYNFLPHSGGFNCNPEKWRLHTYVRFQALDGPCITNEDRDVNYIYLDSVKKAVETGIRPNRFSTGNVIKGIKDPKDIEQKDYEMPQLTELGQRVLGVTPWE